MRWKPKGSFSQQTLLWCCFLLLMALSLLCLLCHCVTISEGTVIFYYLVGIYQSRASFLLGLCNIPFLRIRVEIMLSTQHIATAHSRSQLFDSLASAYSPLVSLYLFFPPISAN